MESNNTNKSGQHNGVQEKRCQASLIDLLLVYLARLLILSILLAYLMSLIDVFRTYGYGIAAWPFTALGQYQPHISNDSGKSVFIDWFENILFWYNCAFPGYSRMGCGIGMIAASFWTLHTLPQQRLLERITIGALCGAVIGFRGMLMVTSSPTLVPAAALIFAVFFAVYMAWTNVPKGLASLPIVKTLQ